MLSDQIPCVELVALKALADLDQLEGSWQSIMESSDPEGVALLLRLLLQLRVGSQTPLLQTDELLLQTIPLQSIPGTQY